MNSVKFLFCGYQALLEDFLIRNKNIFVSAIATGDNFSLALFELTSHGCIYTYGYFLYLKYFRLPASPLRWR